MDSDSKHVFGRNAQVDIAVDNMTDAWWVSRCFPNDGQSISEPSYFDLTLHNIGVASPDEVNRRVRLTHLGPGDNRIGRSFFYPSERAHRLITFCYVRECKRFVGLFEDVEEFKGTLALYKTERDKKPDAAIHLAWAPLEMFVEGSQIFVAYSNGSVEVFKCANDSGPNPDGAAEISMRSEFFACKGPEKCRDSQFSGIVPTVGPYQTVGFSSPSLGIIVAVFAGTSEISPVPQTPPSTSRGILRWFKPSTPTESRSQSEEKLTSVLLLCSIFSTAEADPEHEGTLLNLTRQDSSGDNDPLSNVASASISTPSSEGSFDSHGSDSREDSHLEESPDRLRRKDFKVRLILEKLRTARINSELRLGLPGDRSSPPSGISTPRGPPASETEQSTPPETAAGPCEKAPVTVRLLLSPNAQFFLLHFNTNELLVFTLAPEHPCVPVRMTSLKGSSSPRGPGSVVSESSARSYAQLPTQQGSDSLWPYVLSTYLVPKVFVDIAWRVFTGDRPLLVKSRSQSLSTSPCKLPAKPGLEGSLQTLCCPIQHRIEFLRLLQISFGTSSTRKLESADVEYIDAFHLQLLISDVPRLRELLDRGDSSLLVGDQPVLVSINLQVKSSAMLGRTRATSTPLPLPNFKLGSLRSSFIKWSSRPLSNQHKQCLSVASDEEIAFLAAKTASPPEFTHLSATYMRYILASSKLIHGNKVSAIDTFARKKSTSTCCLAMLRSFNVFGGPLPDDSHEILEKLKFWNSLVSLSGASLMRAVDQEEQMDELEEFISNQWLARENEDAKTLSSIGEAFSVFSILYFIISSSRPSHLQTEILSRLDRLWSLADESVSGTAFGQFTAAPDAIASTTPEPCISFSTDCILRQIVPLALRQFVLKGLLPSVMQLLFLGNSGVSFLSLDRFLNLISAIDPSSENALCHLFVLLNCLRMRYPELTGAQISKLFDVSVDVLVSVPGSLARIEHISLCLAGISLFVCPIESIPEDVRMEIRDSMIMFLNAAAKSCAAWAFFLADFGIFSSQLPESASSLIRSPPDFRNRLDSTLKLAELQGEFRAGPDIWTVPRQPDWSYDSATTVKQSEVSGHMLDVPANALEQRFFNLYCAYLSPTEFSSLTSKFHEVVGEKMKTAFIKIGIYVMLIRKCSNLTWLSLSEFLALDFHSIIRVFIGSRLPGQNSAADSSTYEKALVDCTTILRMVEALPEIAQPVSQISGLLYSPVRKCSSVSASLDIGLFIKNLVRLPVIPLESLISVMHLPACQELRGPSVFGEFMSRVETDTLDSRRNGVELTEQYLCAAAFATNKIYGNEKRSIQIMQCLITHYCNLVGTSQQMSLLALLALKKSRPELREMTARVSARELINCLLQSPVGQQKSLVLLLNSIMSDSEFASELSTSELPEVYFAYQLTSLFTPSVRETMSDIHRSGAMGQWDAQTLRRVATVIKVANQFAHHWSLLAACQTIRTPQERADDNCSRPIYVEPDYITCLSLTEFWKKWTSEFFFHVFVTLRGKLAQTTNEEDSCRQVFEATQVLLRTAPKRIRESKEHEEHILECCFGLFEKVSAAGDSTFHPRELLEVNSVLVRILGGLSGSLSPKSSARRLGSILTLCLDSQLGAYQEDYLFDTQMSALQSAPGPAAMEFVRTGIRGFLGAAPRVLFRESVTYQHRELTEFALTSRIAKSLLQAMKSGPSAELVPTLSSLLDHGRCYFGWDNDRQESVRVMSKIIGLAEDLLGSKTVQNLQQIWLPMAVLGFDAQLPGGAPESLKRMIVHMRNMADIEPQFDPDPGDLHDFPPFKVSASQNIRSAISGAMKESLKVSQDPQTSQDCANLLRLSAQVLNAEDVLICARELKEHRKEFGSLDLPADLDDEDQEVGNRSLGSLVATLKTKQDASLKVKALLGGNLEPQAASALTAPELRVSRSDKKRLLNVILDDDERIEGQLMLQVRRRAHQARAAEVASKVHKRGSDGSGSEPSESGNGAGGRRKSDKDDQRWNSNTNVQTNPDTVQKNGSQNSNARKDVENMNNSLLCSGCGSDERDWHHEPSRELATPNAVCQQLLNTNNYDSVPGSSSIEILRVSENEVEPMATPQEADNVHSLLDSNINTFKEDRKKHERAAPAAIKNCFSVGKSLWDEMETVVDSPAADVAPKKSLLSRKKPAKRKAKIRKAPEPIAADFNFKSQQVSSLEIPIAATDEEPVPVLQEVQVPAPMTDQTPIAQTNELDRDPKGSVIAVDFFLWDQQSSDGRECEPKSGLPNVNAPLGHEKLDLTTSCGISQSGLVVHGVEATESTIERGTKTEGCNSANLSSNSFDREDVTHEQLVNLGGLSGEHSTFTDRNNGQFPAPDCQIIGSEQFDSVVQKDLLVPLPPCDVIICAQVEDHLASSQWGALTGKKKCDLKFASGLLDENVGFESSARHKRVEVKDCPAESSENCAQFAGSSEDLGLQKHAGAGRRQEQRPDELPHPSGSLSEESLFEREGLINISEVPQPAAEVQSRTVGCYNIESASCEMGRVDVDSESPAFKLLGPTFPDVLAHDQQPFDEFAGNVLCVDSPGDDLLEKLEEQGHIQSCGQNVTEEVPSAESDTTREIQNEIVRQALETENRPDDHVDIENSAQELSWDEGERDNYLVRGCVQDDLARELKTDDFRNQALEGSSSHTTQSHVEIKQRQTDPLDIEGAEETMPVSKCGTRTGESLLVDSQPLENSNNISDGRALEKNAEVMTCEVSSDHDGLPEAECPVMRGSSLSQNGGDVGSILDERKNLKECISQEQQSEEFGFLVPSPSDHELISLIEALNTDINCEGSENAPALCPADDSSKCSDVASSVHKSNVDVKCAGLFSQWPDGTLKETDGLECRSAGSIKLTSVNSENQDGSLAECHNEQPGVDDLLERVGKSFAPGRIEMRWRTSELMVKLVSCPCSDLQAQIIPEMISDLAQLYNLSQQSCTRFLLHSLLRTIRKPEQQRLAICNFDNEIRRILAAHPFVQLLKWLPKQSTWFQLRDELAKLTNDELIKEACDLFLTSVIEYKVITIYDS